MNPGIDNKVSTYDVPILETPEEILDFVSTFDDPINDYFYEYALRFNRVNTLVNSTLFIDHSKTDRASIISLSNSALKEVEDFIAFCKEMESWSKTTFEPTIEEAKKNVTNKTFTTSRNLGMSDTAYARRLVEMYLDSSYETTFSPSDISRHTGVEMEKIRFLMRQVSSEFLTEVDIVDEVTYGDQVEFCETVRDTAGAVNSTLALATPLGAFGTATATATTTAAAATGWLQKAKYTYTVFENTSAAITFAGNVVNVSVEEENIPTAVKTVTKYNSYVGLVFGGVSGFNSSEKADKALAIIGTTSDGVTTYFNITEDGIKASNKAQLITTPENINPDNLNGVLVKGDYKIPNQEEVDNWNYSDFDWTQKGEDYWENIYDEIEDITAESYLELENEFKNFATEWSNQIQKNSTQEEKIIREAELPKFFDKEDIENKYENHAQLDIIPNLEDFEVSITSTGSTGLAPYEVVFKASPNTKFLRENLKLHWDFDDGTTYTQIIGDDDFNPEIKHIFINEDTYNVVLRCEDIRGFTAEAQLDITIGNNLQEVIDCYKGKEAIIHVPPGIYTGGYNNGIVLKLWEGITLWGNKDSSFIDATIEMYPNTKIEGFTLRGGDWGVIIDTEDSNATINIESYDIEIVGNNFIAPDYQTAIWLTPLYINEKEIPYSGEIKNNTSNGLGRFLLCGTFNGELSYNTIKNTYNEPSIEFSGLFNSTINSNVFENAGGMLFYSDTENSNIFENTFTNTTSSQALSFAGRLTSGTQVIKNIIKESPLGKGGISISSILENALFSENKITNSSGLGIYIDKVEGEVSSNEISDNNSKDASLMINILAPTGIVKDNLIINNINNFNYIWPNSYSGIQVTRVQGNLINNTVTNNSGGGLYAIYDGGNISSNVITNNKNAGVSIGSNDSKKPSSLIKDSNTISNNTCNDESYYYKDLYTPWQEDTIPIAPSE